MIEREREHFAVNNGIRRTYTYNSMGLMMNAQNSDARYFEAIRQPNQNRKVALRFLFQFIVEYR